MSGILHSHYIVMSYKMANILIEVMYLACGPKATEWTNICNPSLKASSLDGNSSGGKFLAIHHKEVWLFDKNTEALVIF